MTAHKPTARRHIRLGAFTVVLFCVAFTAFISAGVGDESKDAPDISGVWFYLGPLDSPNNKPIVNTVKLFTKGHWCVTISDPETGRVTHHHGGTYTLKNNEYKETVKYATESRSFLIGRSFSFSMSVEGDTLKQEGVGNSFNEKWARPKKED